VKIGPVDTEMVLLIVKKKKLRKVKYRPIVGRVGRFAERAKLIMLALV